MAVKQIVTKENRTKIEEVKWTKKWCIGVTFCLFKVGFNQLINRIPFMRYWRFLLAVSEIEQQSREQALKHSVYDIKCWYICDFLSLQKCLSILGWDVAVFDQHN